MSRQLEFALHLSSLVVVGYYEMVLHDLVVGTIIIVVTFMVELLVIEHYYY